MASPEVQYTDDSGDTLRVVQVGEAVLFSVVSNGTSEEDAPAVVLAPSQWEDLKHFLNSENPAAFNA